MITRIMMRLGHCDSGSSKRNRKAFHISILNSYVFCVVVVVVVLVLVVAAVVVVGS